MLMRMVYLGFGMWVSEPDFLLMRDLNILPVHDSFCINLQDYPMMPVVHLRYW